MKTVPGNVYTRGGLWALLPAVLLLLAGCSDSSSNDDGGNGSVEGSVVWEESGTIAGEDLIEYTVDVSSGVDALIIYPEIKHSGGGNEPIVWGVLNDTQLTKSEFEQQLDPNNKDESGDGLAQRVEFMHESEDQEGVWADPFGVDNPSSGTWYVYLYSGNDSANSYEYDIGAFLGTWEEFVEEFGSSTAAASTSVSSAGGTDGGDIPASTIAGRFLARVMAGELSWEIGAGAEREVDSSRYPQSGSTALLGHDFYFGEDAVPPAVLSVHRDSVWRHYYSWEDYEANMDRTGE